MNGWRDKINLIIGDNMTKMSFKCPNCKARITVPRGRGRICIKCPKCRIEFLKKT